jgi:hypothetical protein
MYSNALVLKYFANYTLPTTHTGPHYFMLAQVIHHIDACSRSIPLSL